MKASYSTEMSPASIKIHYFLNICSYVDILVHRIYCIMEFFKGENFHKFHESKSLRKFTLEIFTKNTYIRIKTT